MQLSKVDALAALMRGGATMLSRPSCESGPPVYSLVVGMTEAERESLEAQLSEPPAPAESINRLEDFQLCPYCDHNSATFDDDRRWVCDACGEDW
jgi:hypothetical protein